MDRYRCIQAFVRVAECRSFAEAARQLGVAGSVITNRIIQLEKLVGAPLFHRSTRKVSLSDAGKDCFDDCLKLLDQFDLVADRVRASHETASGLLRVSMLPGLALGHLGQVVKDFREAYPEVDLELTVSEQVVNPADGGFDVMLQVFRPSAETLVIERRLFSVQRVFCASPGYLHRHGKPQHPIDLAKHELALYSAYPTRNRWTFARDGEDEVSLELIPSIRSNSVHFLRDFARADGGITCVPAHVCYDELSTGALIPILTEYRLPSLQLLAIYPVTHRQTAKVKLFVDFIERRFSEQPQWKCLPEVGGTQQGVAVHRVGASNRIGSSTAQRRASKSNFSLVTEVKPGQETVRPVGRASRS